MPQDCALSTHQNQYQELTRLCLIFGRDAHPDEIPTSGIILRRNEPRAGRQPGRRFSELLRRFLEQARASLGSEIRIDSLTGSFRTEDRHRWEKRLLILFICPFMGQDIV